MHLTADTLNDLPRGQRINLVNSLSGFKSANLVGTCSDGGEENLAMVGSCFHLGADPALMGMIMRPHSVDRHSLEYLAATGVYTLNQVHEDILKAAHQTSARYPREISEFTATGLTPSYLMGMIMRPHSVDRHSLEYLAATGVYTLNQVHEDILKAAHQTSARYPREISEFTATGLTPSYLPAFQAPFVEEARIKLGMVVIETQTLAVNDTVLVIGAIEHILLPDNAVENDGFVNIERAGTVALSGLDSYHRSQSIGRLSYAKPDKPTHWLHDNAT